MFSMVFSMTHCPTDKKVLRKWELHASLWQRKQFPSIAIEDRFKSAVHLRSTVMPVKRVCKRSIDINESLSGKRSALVWHRCK